MELNPAAVGIIRCPGYARPAIKKAIETTCRSLGFCPSMGSRILLKPNLISARRRDGLACTHPEVIAAMAEWCIDQGAVVVIGDSPAFGSARGVMQALGITAALRGLPVRCSDFTERKQVILAGSFRVGIAAEVLACDLLINLPKIKAHSQLRLTMAVKNYFGTVVGLQKPWWHMRFGGREGRFAELLVELLRLMPAGLSLLDGITAMHRTGPMGGEPFQLGLLAGSTNPVALDTAMLAILGIEPAVTPLWQACRAKSLPGADPGELSFPLLNPEAVRTEGFVVPGTLQPVSFAPGRMLCSSLKRIVANIRQQ